jgi:PKD domain
MQINPSSSESGAFNPRVFLAFILSSVGVLLAMVGLAATPPSGTLSDSTPTLTYTAGPFFQSNPSPLGAGQLDSGPRCDNTSFPCDDYALTVTLPGGYAAAHPNASAKVTMSWTDAGSGNSDYDLYIFKNPRNDCTPNDCTTTDGSEAADYQSASSSNPEVANISPLHDGSQKYTIHIVPYTPTGETVNVKIEFLPGTAVSGVPGFGGADPTTPGVPRYQIFEAPHGSSAEPSNGEFNIGFNPKTGRIMTMNIGPIWRITPGEVQTPKKPECCEGLWEDKSSTVTDTGLDPILWTDQKTGRTFASNSTAGANAVYAYTDTDGDNYVPVGFGPPNGGADHETIGSGPYPASLSVLSTPVNQGEAVYYCSQDIVGPAACQRSDTLGASYGPGVLAYTGTTTECGGLHGHLHVAPDGTAWLPVNQCNGKQGGALTTDGGTTWQEFIVTGSVSQQQGADPSIAIDTDSTVYYAYVNNETVAQGQPPEGHAHVMVSKDGGKTWINDFDLGASHGIKNAAEIEAVGGSSGRAAVGFLGTDIPGDYQALSFQGKWYAFISTTYDQGKTWVTVNSTPNDPVQSMTGVWQQGGGAKDRNLLDFNEITVDDKGHVLYGYSDGCVTGGCIAGTAPNDFVAFMRVARQSGGKGLFAAKDSVEPAVPKPACLSGTRDKTASFLTWKAPDNGGAVITKYQIFRGTTAGGEAISPIGQTVGKTSFIDGTADPAVPDYFYIVKAINIPGTGSASNEIDLKVVAAPPVQNVCAVPGLTVFTDAAGDNTGGVPGTDLLSFDFAQPFAPTGPIKFVFTINTDPITATPVGSGWYVAIKIPDAAPATTFHYSGVRMDGGATGPTFSSYVPGANTSGGVDGRFVASSKPADPASNLDGPNGKITIVVTAADLGLQPGSIIAGFVSGSSQMAGVLTEVYDGMPDSLAFSSSYAVNANQFCAPNAAPTAVLTATPDHGPGPLTVTLSGAGSTDPDAGDTIATYNFDFGDGATASQNSPTIVHTYTAPGEYPARLTVTDSRGLVSTNTALAPIEVNAALRNISTRANVQTGDNVLIAGFIVTGSDPRQILLRGIGPSLKINGQPIAGAMADPTIELHDGTTVIATNDNWKIDDLTGQSQQAAIENTGAAPTDDHESAIVKTLNPGAYTVVLRGKGNTTGIAVVEAFDLDPLANSKLANISTRGVVQTADNRMIAGFVAGPDNAAPTGILIRGMGPSLSNSGVSNALADPTLELHDSNGTTLRTNDNWKDTQQADIEATGIPPGNNLESAILVDVAPGAYTAILAGQGNTTGVGLIEIYNVH